MSVRSPCVGVCDAKFQTPCNGCGRFMTEVTSWNNMPDRFRLMIIRRAKREGFLRDEVLHRYPNEVLE